MKEEEVLSLLPQCHCSSFLSFNEPFLNSETQDTVQANQSCLICLAPLIIKHYSVCSFPGHVCETLHGLAVLIWRQRCLSAGMEGEVICRHGVQGHLQNCSGCVELKCRFFIISLFWLTVLSHFPSFSSLNGSYYL